MGTDISSLRYVAYFEVDILFACTTIDVQLNPLPPIALRLYTLPYWSNPPIFNFWHSGALALRTERQSARMSKIKNGGLDEYDAEPFEQQQLGTAGVVGVKRVVPSSGVESTTYILHFCPKHWSVNDEHKIVRHSNWAK